MRVTALILGSVLAGACRVAPPQPIRVDDPDRLDVYGGTGAQSADLRNFARCVVEAMGRDLPSPAGDPAPAILFRPIDNQTSQQLDTFLILDAIVAEARRSLGGRAALLTTRGERDGERVQDDQQRGVRLGNESPPALLMPNLIFRGALREQAIDTAVGRTRYVQFSFELTTVQGIVSTSGVVDWKRTEERHPIYQRRRT